MLCTKVERANIVKVFFRILGSDPLYRPFMRWRINKIDAVARQIAWTLH